MKISAKRLVLAILLCATVMNAAAQTAKVYVSSQAGDRLAAKPELKFTDRKPPAGATFEIDDAVHFQ